MQSLDHGRGDGVQSLDHVGKEGSKHSLATPLSRWSEVQTRFRMTHVDNNLMLCAYFIFIARCSVRVQEQPVAVHTLELVSSSRRARSWPGKRAKFVGLYFVLVEEIEPGNAAAFRGTKTVCVLVCCVC